MTGLLPSRALPVLMYHRIGVPAGGDPGLWVSEEMFDRQLQWLLDRGFRTLSLDESFACLEAGETPSRAVLLTFDDAFAETVEHAARRLRQVGLRAAVFVPAGLMGKTVELLHPRAGGRASSPGRIVDRAQLRAWCEQGLDVGSHSLSHIDLTRCSAADLRLETLESKQRLEQILSRPVNDFCYPFALHDAASRQAVAAAGYRAAYAGEPPVADLFSVPRMMVYPDDTEARFRRKLSGYYYWLSAWHRRLVRLMGTRGASRS